MARFILGRLIGGIVILWLVSVLAFVLFFVVPKALGNNPAVLFAGRSPDPATIAGVTRKLGLDRSYVDQYWDFLRGVFVGRHFDSGSDRSWCPAPCLGYSFRNDQPVWSEIVDALPVTASLSIGAAVLFLVVGVSTGVISAVRRGGLFDRIAAAVSLAGVSLPVYFTGLLLLLLVSYKWHIIDNVHYVDFTHNPALWAWNLIPAWLVLSLLYTANYQRLTRASMIETLGEDYVRTARAKGLRERTVIGKHALRPALTPIVTIFGLDLGVLFGGAILTEHTFGFRGLGAISIDAVNTQDLPVTMGVTLFAAFFIILANVLVDVTYAFIDPRVRPS
ncbi:ABC-type dipeptide/oligopeptide/nickel transport system, permease component [Frankia torreyi]|uniref:ABC-type dipeptide/oligopeptide/nickel transport system, permease component n=1 Tax=Frankia torreyi TaxID=1856 RepID=A0A0D8BFQ0_9ACTN|nr:MULTISPECIES: ABC transporter permease [Frankia]KJE23118.1 ABC-type dipeptide/oligopeptide/nickel transport system, permease component [Frankia torreyi]KQC36841.1 ABC transporter permease [Frankia sp. ACN1ag]KQM06641.1 ABC-type dipeptide/oligopeptide/nickel transport system, permease component [Frankia sp. CpI1-P]